MTEEEMRIAIGRECKTLGGWYCPICRASLPSTLAAACPKCGTEMHRDGPNYPYDLNAMRVAEIRLNPKQRKEYIWKLQEGFLPETSAAQALGCFATAAKRAEAFLRTIGKWKD